MTTLFAATVYETYGDMSGLFDIRAIRESLTGAQAVLDAEVSRQGLEPLRWEYLFGGAKANQNGLTYDVRTVRR